MFVTGQPMLQIYQDLYSVYFVVVRFACSVGNNLYRVMCLFSARMNIFGIKGLQCCRMSQTQIPRKNILINGSGSSNAS